MASTQSQKSKGGRPRKTNGKIQPIQQGPSGQPQAKRQKTSTYRLTMRSGGRLTSQRHDSVVSDAAASESSQQGSEIEVATPAEDKREPNEVVQIPAVVRTPRRNVIKEWIPLRQQYMDELIRHDGLADSHVSQDCWSCALENIRSVGTIKCNDCIRGRLLCQACAVREHRSTPLHRVEEWLGDYFSKTSLRELGLIIYLCHGGDTCPDPGGAKLKFGLCDTSGFHELHIVYCGCLHNGAGIIPQWKQLMRMGWYPASRERPSTAFTFRVLDFFHELTHQGKANLYDFYKTLDRITDNSGTLASWNRYKQFGIVMRQWRNLHMLKRSGRGHDPAGIDATAEGECVVQCAACPHPGRNLPDGWNNAPPHIAWIYTLFLMLDANFRLKLKDRGFEDVELSIGWSYYVAETKYKTFIKQFGDQDEENTCSAEHKAIRDANISRGSYLASGTGACLCGRHCLVRKNGVADLEKGEKYCTMDYILLASLIGTALALFVTYDIACQYSKNFKKRVREFPPCMQFSPNNVNVRWAIPKKHFPVHGKKDHSRYSLNYVPFVGRTYGEGIESGWSHMNPVSTSTKEMAPAVCTETIDDHWGSWNWQKTIGFGSLFFRNLCAAFEMKEKHDAIFTAYNATFPADTVAVWKADIERWEADHSSKPDPFIEETHATTMNEIKLKLATEDATEAARGSAFQHEVTPSAFLSIGLEIEDQQRILRSRAKGKQSVGDMTSLQTKRSALHHRIDSWRKIQELYMPYVSALLAQLVPATGSATFDLDDATVMNPEDTPLFLPSGLPAHLRIGDNISSFARREGELRIAIADDSLADIRRLRRTMAGVSQFKHLNVSGSGQKANTRIRTLYDKFKDKVVVAADRYRAAYAALTVLQPAGDWFQRLRSLDNKDIRGPGHDDEEILGEGRREMSWIWLVRGGAEANGSDTADLNKCMQVEWSKTRARARRWTEETVLLQEEMRRVLSFFEWKAGWWRHRASLRQVSPDIASGLRGYAEKQACVYEGLAWRFAGQWLPLLTQHNITPEWAIRYTSSDCVPVRRSAWQSRRAQLLEDTVSSESEEE